MQTTYHRYPQHPSANSPIKNSIYHNSLYINQYDSRNRFLEQFDLYLGVANYQIILFVCFCLPVVHIIYLQTVVFIFLAPFPYPMQVFVAWFFVAGSNKKSVNWLADV